MFDGCYSLYCSLIHSPVHCAFYIKQLYVIRWASCAIFQILAKFSSGAFQDGEKYVNYFVASIPASFGQIFHFTRHKMAENQQKTFKRRPNKVMSDQKLKNVRGGGE